MTMNDLEGKLIARVFTEGKVIAGVFTVVRRDDREEAAKVSKQWFRYVVENVKSISVEDVLWMEQLAVFLGEVYSKNFTWCCFKKTADYMNGQDDKVFFAFSSIDSGGPNFEKPYPFGSELKPQIFPNLTKLCWREATQYKGCTTLLFKNIPCLEQVCLHVNRMGKEWARVVPKSVTLLDLKIEELSPDIEHDFCITYICKEPSTLKVFSLSALKHIPKKMFHDFEALTALKQITLNTTAEKDEVGPVMLHVLSCCKQLVSFNVRGLEIDEAWHKIVPRNIKWIKLWKPTIAQTILTQFSFEYILEDVSTIKSLKVVGNSFDKCNPDAFKTLNRLKRLSLLLSPQTSNSDISHAISRNVLFSHNLSFISLATATITKAWYKIIPLTVTNLVIGEIIIDESVANYFSPQYILSEPAGLRVLDLPVVHNVGGTIEKNFFDKMFGLKSLRLGCSPITLACIQSLLLNCTKLKELSLSLVEGKDFSSSSDPIRILSVNDVELVVDVVHPTQIFEHFPNVKRVNMTLTGEEALVADFSFAWHFLDTLQIQFKHRLTQNTFIVLSKKAKSGFKYVYISDDVEGYHTFHLSNSLSWISCQLYADLSKGDVIRFPYGFSAASVPVKVEKSLEMTKDKSEERNAGGYFKNLRKYVNRVWARSPKQTN